MLCGSTKSELLQGRKGIVVKAVGPQCVRDTQLSGADNAAKPGTVFLLVFTLFSVDKSVPFGRLYWSIIGSGLTAAVKQPLVCCAVGTRLNIKNQA